MPTFDVIISHIDPKTKVETKMTINVNLELGMDTDDIIEEALFEAKKKYKNLDWNREPNGNYHYEVEDVMEHKGKL